MLDSPKVLGESKCQTIRNYKNTEIITETEREKDREEKREQERERVVKIPKQVEKLTLRRISNKFKPRSLINDLKIKIIK